MRHDARPTPSSCAVAAAPARAEWHSAKFDSRRQAAPARIEPPSATLLLRSVRVSESSPAAVPGALAPPGGGPGTTHWRSGARAVRRAAPGRRSLRESPRSQRNRLIARVSPAYPRRPGRRRPEGQRNSLFLGSISGMAERTGLEPATPGVTGRYSNQLNYRSTEGGANPIGRPAQCPSVCRGEASAPAGSRRAVGLAGVTIP